MTVPRRLLNAMDEIDPQRPYPPNAARLAEKKALSLSRRSRVSTLASTLDGCKDQASAMGTMPKSPATCLRGRFELYDAPPHQVRLQGGDASSDSYCYP